MKRLGMAVLAGALVSVMVSGGALAADVGPIVLPSTPPPVPLAPPPGFSFAGPYVGTYGGLLVDEAFQAGIQGGFNFVRGHVLIGAEAQVGVVFGGRLAFEGDLNARLGVILGERFLVYGEGGIGLFAGTPIYTAGGGVEIGLGQSLSVFAEAKAVGELGQPLSAFQVQGGINWHPNY
jgi:opacity protein-like surface antigen